MTHFVCTGECAGVSEDPGMCQSEQCSRKGKQLKACACEDESHAPVKEDAA